VTGDHLLGLPLRREPVPPRCHLGLPRPPLQRLFLRQEAVLLVPRPGLLLRVRRAPLPLRLQAPPPVLPRVEHPLLLD